MFTFLHQIIRPLGDSKHLNHQLPSQLMERANARGGHEAQQMRAAALSALGVVR